MTPLGKALVFYLKYMAEMDRLYCPEDYAGEPDLTGVDDPEHVREIATTVGAAASEKAAEFLELCAKGIVDHFTGLGATIVYKKKRSFLLRNWWWGAQVQVPSVPGGEFSCAVGVWQPPVRIISVDRDVCGVVVPWLWSKGGRKAEDTISEILGGWSHSRGADGLVEFRGTIALACIPIKPQPLDSFDVDREPVIAEVAKTFARIGAKETKAIAKFVAGLKQPEED
jgi:hypothetical protein